MTTIDYEQLILQGIKDLPESMLTEITDFVLFVRQRALNSNQFYTSMLALEGQILSQAQQSHLDEEFANYEQQYPIE